MTDAVNESVKALISSPYLRLYHTAVSSPAEWTDTL